MKQVLIILFLFIQFSLFSQIGPCSIEGGRQKLDLYFMKDHLPDPFDMGSVGDDNMWLFGSLQSPRSQTYNYTIASEARNSSFFEDAEMVLKEPQGKEIFFVNRNDKWYELGYVSTEDNSMDPQVVRYDVPISACTPTSYNRTNAFQATFTIDGDVVTKGYRDIKDATGTLYLADGFYDADRIRRDITINSSGKSVTKSSYIFVDQLTGACLMKVELDDNDKPENILYKTVQASSPRPNLIESTRFLLYPDVGYGEVRLEFNNFEPGYYSMVIFDIIGRKIWSKVYSIDNDITFKEDLSFLPRGRYHYTIIDGNQNKVVTRRLAIIKS